MVFVGEVEFYFNVCFQGLAAEIAELEKERDHLEAELKRVSLSLSSLFVTVIRGYADYMLKVHVAFQKI